MKFTNKEKRKLLDESVTLDLLTLGQSTRLLWWSVFNKIRMDHFYESLSIGKIAVVAYKDAKSIK